MAQRHHAGAGRSRLSSPQAEESMASFHNSAKTKSFCRKAAYCERPRYESAVCVMPACSDDREQDPLTVLSDADQPISVLPCRSGLAETAGQNH